MSWRDTSPGRREAAEGPDAQLLEVARDSIAHGVEHGTALTVELRAFDPALREPRACFVTLHAQERLRGCVGSLEAGAPLVVEAARNAYRAAFEDPRFRFVRAPELADLAVSVSILSPLEPLRVDSEASLLGAIRPGVDGLVLRGDGRSATFLPAVWRQLPDPKAFVANLLRKAGLPESAWSEDWRWQRFDAREVG